MQRAIDKYAAMRERKNLAWSIPVYKSCSDKRMLHKTKCALLNSFANK